LLPLAGSVFEAAPALADSDSVPRLELEREALLLGQEAAVLAAPELADMALELAGVAMLDIALEPAPELWGGHAETVFPTLAPKVLLLGLSETAPLAAAAAASCASSSVVAGRAGLASALAPRAATCTSEAACECDGEANKYAPTATASTPAAAAATSRVSRCCLTKACIFRHER